MANLYWKKDKKIPQEITANIINTVLIKSNIKTLALSQEVNLPPHLQMPRVKAKESSKDYIG